MYEKTFAPALIIGLGWYLALLSAGVTCSAQAEPLNRSDATLSLQTTPTLETKDRLEIGSTNEMVILGGVIALIIFAPIVVSRKN